MIVGDVARRAPTATQFDALAHEMPWSVWLTGLGDACAAQVEPPFVVAEISGALLDTFPTAQQSLAVTQSTSLYCADAPDGGV
jgi:hypothetical protein